MEGQVRDGGGEDVRRARALAEEEKKLLLAQKASDRKDVDLATAAKKLANAAEDVKSWKTKAEAVEFKLAEAVARLAELAEELATSEKKRKALERDAEVARGKAEKAAATAEKKLSDAREETSSWKLKVAAADETLAASAAKRKETENQLETLLKDLEKSRADEASLRESLKTARASLETSEASATSLRESERMLTAAVESNAEELKGLRKQLEDMRVDRDKEKTSVKESRVQNGVLRMRLAAGFRDGCQQRRDHVPEQKGGGAEKSQLERAAEEVRKLAALEQARDEATAATVALQKRMDDADAEFKRTLEQRASRIAELESDASAARLESEKSKAQKTQSENKEQTRVMIIKETELRETRCARR